MKIIASLAILILVLVFFRAQWLLWIGNFLIIQNTLRPADVIHVIAGEDYRTEYAIKLYEQGFGEHLFFTGGWCKVHQYQHGEHAEEIALKEEIPLDAIAFDDSEVTSTYMEAERLKAWIDTRPYPIRSVMVVSDPFHMRRARWIYRKVLGIQIQLQMAPVPFELTPYQRTWWMDQESRKYVLEEYEKFVYNIFRYQISRGKFQEWLVAMDHN